MTCKHLIKYMLSILYAEVLNIEQKSRHCQIYHENVQLDWDRYSLG